MMLGSTFLEAAAAVEPLLATPAVDDRWDEPSALPLITVGELCGHLVRAVATVRHYLDAAEPGGDDLLDAPGYLTSIDDLDGDLTSRLHQGIRARAAEEAAGGPAAVRAAWNEALAALRSRLPREPEGRRLAVLGNRVMLLDDYLVTRLLEVIVHGDDLAASLSVDVPSFPPTAATPVIACLVEAARRRHGDLAVLRALTRRERDTDDALRVL